MAQKKLKVFRIFLDEETGNIFDGYFLDFFTPLEIAHISKSSFSQLLVNGDMDLSRYQLGKNEKAPKFNNIHVRGRFIGSKYITSLPEGCLELDLSKCGKNFLNQDIVLPKLFCVLNCAYCISSLDVLCGKISPIAEEVIVEAKLIKPSTLIENSEKMAAARKFINMYPNVRVYDTSKKYELHEVLETIDNQKEISKENSVKSTDEQIVEKQPAKKIAGKHLDNKDIFDLIKQDHAFDEYDINDEDLMRQIRFVVSKATNVSKNMMVREDGARVSCIDATDWLTVRQTLLKKLSIEKEIDKIDENQPEPTITEQKVKPVEAPNKESVSSTPKPINIQKYIPDDIVKQVKRSCGADKLKNILIAINEINLDVLDDFNYQGGVKIIKNDILTVSSDIQKEKGCSLVQSCDGNANHDRKRLVWTIGDGPDNTVVIVCLGFLKAHAETIKKYNSYAIALKNARERHTFTKEDLSEYKNVTDVLNELYSDNSGILKQNIIDNNEKPR